MGKCGSYFGLESSKFVLFGLHIYFIQTETDPNEEPKLWKSSNNLNSDTLELKTIKYRMKRDSNNLQVC